MILNISLEDYKGLGSVKKINYNVSTGFVNPIFQTAIYRYLVVNQIYPRKSQIAVKLWTI